MIDFDRGRLLRGATRFGRTRSSPNEHPFGGEAR